MRGAREWRVRVYAVAPSGLVAVVQTLPGFYTKENAERKSLAIAASLNLDRRVDDFRIVETYAAAEHIDAVPYRRGDYYGEPA